MRVDDSPLTTDIDTTAKEIWRQDPNRIGLLFVNLSANDVFFNIRPDVSTTNGIQLVGSGDSLVLSWKEDLILPCWLGTGSPTSITAPSSVGVCCCSEDPKPNADAHPVARRHSFQPSRANAPHHIRHRHRALCDTWLGPKRRCESSTRVRRVVLFADLCCTRVYL